MKDALGNDIVIGNTYGYSSSSGGWSHTVVGTAISFTPKGKVTIKVIATNTFLYGEPSDYQKVTAEKINISTHMVFPVQL